MFFFLVGIKRLFIGILTVNIFLAVLFCQIKMLILLFCCKNQETSIKNLVTFMF